MSGAKRNTLVSRAARLAGTLSEERLVLLNHVMHHIVTCPRDDLIVFEAAIGEMQLRQSSRTSNK
jgi:hypothetical protein